MLEFQPELRPFFFLDFEYEEIPGALGQGELSIAPSFFFFLLSVC